MDDCITIDQEIDAVVEAVADDRVDNGIAKRKCLFFILIVALIAGFLYGMGPETSDYETPIDVGNSFVITFAVLFWCYQDAEEHKFKFSRKFSKGFALFPHICFPWYIMRVRKGRACLRVFARTAMFGGLYLLVMGLGYALGMLVSYIT